MQEACLDVPIQEVDQPVLDVAQLGAYLLAVPEGQVGPVLQQLFEVVDGKSADADIVFVGLGELPMQVVPLQAELAEKLTFLDDLLDLFIAIVVDEADLDGTFLDEVDLIVIVGLEIYIFSLGHIDDMVLHLQRFIFIVGQVAPIKVTKFGFCMVVPLDLRKI
jgi:hypothetical protein